MALLVKFIAVENKAEIDHKEYVNKILSSLCNAGLIKYMMLPLEEMGDGSSPVKELDDERNVICGINFEML